MRYRQRATRPVHGAAVAPRRPFALSALLGGVAYLALTAPVSAETLIEAWTRAYATNPTIEAQRAQLRATDEAVAQALSGWRPTVVASGSVGHTESDANFVTTAADSRDPVNLTLQVRQPLYRGGRTVASTARAEKDVQAQRARLQAIEQQVMLDVGTAYMTVLRDQAVLELNTNNVRVLERQLQAARDRFSVGEVTRTDVAQAEARLSRARADRVQAEGNLQNSQAEYERVVGMAPGVLAPPPTIPHVPRSKDEAVEAAQTGNPSVVSAAFTAQSATDNVRVVEGELYPSIDLVGQLSRDYGTTTSSSRVDQASLQAQLTVPLYQSGAVHSRVREAKQIASLRRAQVEETRRQAAENAASAWENVVASRARIVSLQDEVRASSIALEGVQQEALVGTRTVLDVLDAEQELLNARVNLVQSQTDLTVAIFSLASAMGYFTAERLGLPVDYYNVDENFQNVRNKIWGTDIDG